MDIKFERLNLFFDKIKTIGFWQRLFGWRQIKSLSYDAYEEFKGLVSTLDRISKETDQSKNSIAILTNDNEHLKSENIKLESLQGAIKDKLNTTEREVSDLKASLASKDETIRQAERKTNEQKTDIVLLKEKIEQLTDDISQLKEENTIYKQTEIDRKTSYENNVANLSSLKEQIQQERQKEQDEHRREEIERLESMKEIWAKHQESVKNAIKMICEKHTIEYLDKVPFKGNPDNTIKLCDEYVIFDAKSPSSDDLQNFPIYIKTQTEAVKKYMTKDGVRRDIFLVIPSNTVNVIESFSYNMADYNVYIVTLDVLEPLILSLRKIEDYEFISQLTPEERENICRIIGKFAHMTKRRIQVDQFFAWEFLDILTKCKADLPKEVLDKVIEFEKSEKLNPPQERRAKQISNKELESDNEKIQREAEAKGIIFPSALQKKLKKMPLYENEKADKDNNR